MEREQTLADLMREIGIEPPRRPSPLRPRLEPGSRTRSTVGQVAPMLPLEAPPSRAQQRAEYDAAQRSATRPRAAPAYQAPRNQFAETGQYGLEMTGLPSVRRSARAFASGDMETGIEEGAMGALGVGTLLVGGRGARAPRPMPEAPPMRAPVAEPAGALRPPPRQLGTASDGSVMPVRPPEPFRQSMVGGSDDLAAAARPGALRPAPDGSPPQPRGGGSQTFDVGAMTALRQEYRDHFGDPLPRDLPQMPEVEIPLAQLRRNQIGSLDRADAREYSRLTTQAPPILVRRVGRNSWRIIDGNRRVTAADLRGDPTVRAIDATDLFSDGGRQ